MDNALKDFEGKAMERDEDRYYYVAGYRFEKDRKYTVEDYEALPENVRVELINGVFHELYPYWLIVPDTVNSEDNLSCLRRKQCKHIFLRHLILLYNARDNILIRCAHFSHAFNLTRNLFLLIASL